MADRERIDMEKVHDAQCEQVRSTVWVECSCEQRAKTAREIEAWVAECQTERGA